MNLTQNEIERLSNSKNKEEWNKMINEILHKRDGRYPYDWYIKVMLSGLAYKTKELYQLKPFMPNINRALKLIREFHNLTQSKCAEKLGVSQVVVSTIESGKSVSFSMLTRYAEVFEIPEWQILFFSEHMKETGLDNLPLREFISNRVLRILEYIAKKAEISEIQKDD